MVEAEDDDVVVTSRELECARPRPNLLPSMKMNRKITRLSTSDVLRTMIRPSNCDI